MKKTTLMAVAVAATILTTGCNKEENQTIPQRNSEMALRVTGGIQALTRVQGAVWQNNDAIGIFMLDNGATTISEASENRKYTTSSGDGKFSPVTSPVDQTIYFPLIGKTDFVSYYPWQSITKSVDDKYLYSVDVSSQVTQESIDLMSADKVSGNDKDNTAVAFKFTHKLVKIVLTQINNGDGLLASDLEGLTVKLTNQRTKATYDVIAGGEVVVNTTEAKSDVNLLVSTDSKSAEAIVLPAASTLGMELVFTLANGDVYRWELSNAVQSAVFTAAHKYSYKITISKKGLNVTASITDWVSGNGADGEEGTAQ